MENASLPRVRLRRRVAPDAPTVPARTTPRRPWRRPGLLAAALALLAGGIVAAVATGGDGGDDLVAMIEPPTTVRLPPRSTTTTTPRPVTVPIVPLPPTPVTTGRPAPLAPSSSTTTTEGGGDEPTTTTLVCQNSTDPACGPFFWDPPPDPDQPLTVVIEYPGTPLVDRQYRVTLSDADAVVVCWKVWNTGTGEVLSEQPCPAPSCPTMYGPWTPPAKAVGGPAPLTGPLLIGTVSVHAESAGYGCSPYGSVADVVG